MSLNEQNLEQSTDNLTKRDSLSYSVDFDKPDRFSLLTDSPEIQFNFENSGEEFHFEDVPSISSTQLRRREIFQKYKNLQPVDQTSKESDIISSFNQIFHVKDNSDPEGASTLHVDSFKKKPVKQEEGEKIEAKTSLQTLASVQNSFALEPKDVDNVNEGQKVEIGVFSSMESIDYYDKIKRGQIQTLNSMGSNQKIITDTPNNTAINDSSVYFSSKKPNEPIKANFTYSSAPQQPLPHNQQSIYLSPLNQHNQYNQYNQQNQLQERESIELEPYIKQSDDEQQNQKKLSNPIFKEEDRIPEFLRKARKLNSIYPNFNHPLFKFENEGKYCEILATAFEQSLNILEKITFLVLDETKKLKVLPAQMCSLPYFMNSKWEKLNPIPELWLIKPRTNFSKDVINQQKITKAMQNYRDVINYYKVYNFLSLGEYERQEKYLKARVKFWSLEKNLRSISEDIYQLTLNLGYPPLYYQYLGFLHASAPKQRTEKQIAYHRNLLGKVLYNRQLKQPLTCSEVGNAVKVKLQKQLKFLCPF